MTIFLKCSELLLPDGEQEVQNAGDKTSSESTSLKPETQTEQVAMATAAVAAGPTHVVSVPLPPVEDVKSKKGEH